MKKKVYIIRHGQTRFNEKDLIQGVCDSPLTNLGHVQAKAARDWFDQRGIHFDYAACSTLNRTEQTLHHLCDLPYERIEGLREFDYGTLEGESCKEYTGSFMEDPENYFFRYGGEKRSEAGKRIQETMEEIMSRPEVHQALIVSHGDISYQFAQMVDQSKAEKLRKFSNCVIYEFDYEDGNFSLINITDDHVQTLGNIPSYPDWVCWPKLSK